MENQQLGNINRSLQAAALWETRREEIVRMYHTEGLSQAALAAHYGVAQAAMCKVLQRIGIKAKSRGRTGAENGRYLHGMASTLYRKKIDKRQCNRCGSKDQLLVHHKNGDHFDNKKANLEVLCSPCHTSHHKREYWAKRKALS